MGIETRNDTRGFWTAGVIRFILSNLPADRLCGKWSDNFLFLGGAGLEGAGD